MPSPTRDDTRLRMLLAGGCALVVLCCGIAVWMRTAQNIEHPTSSAQHRSGSLLKGALPSATHADGTHVSAVRPALAGKATRAVPEPRLISTIEPPKATRVDRYATLPVLLVREDKPKDGDVIVRVRLLNNAKFKYPLLRVRDELRRTAAGDVLVKQEAMVGDHVMVKFKPGVTEAQVLAKLKPLEATVRKQMRASGLWLIAFAHPDLDTIPTALNVLNKAADLIESADADFIAHASTVPNDTYFSLLWGLNNTGASGGVNDVDIDAPEAWNLHTGTKAVVVGCIDTGIDYTHQDLAANIWTNPGEIAGNGLDDDANGYIDDVRGWDFVNADNDPRDDHYHGTHTSGTIGAAGNNGEGVTGVCWKVSLMALKFLDDEGSGTTSDAVDAIYYATAKGAFLTSNSWGGDGYTQAMFDAIADANTHGSLFIAAAGNDGSNNETTPTYPANFDVPNMITVAATTRTGAMASFSNYGATTVHIAAPGLDVGSTAPDAYGTYIYASGTSMATPHVSGVCALLKSYRPALSALEVKAIVLGTAQPLASLVGKCSTGGMVNANEALRAGAGLVVSPGGVFLATAPVGGVVAPQTRVYSITNRSAASVSWTSSTSQPWLSISPTSGTLAVGQAMPITAQISPSVSSLVGGTQSATFTITNPTPTPQNVTLPVRVNIESTRVFEFNLNTLPEGWTMTGEWQYGTPLGAGGKVAGDANTYGEADPTSGATGAKVLGVDLTGDYSIAIGGPYYVKTAAIDLSQYEGTRLRFQRWLNTDFPPYATATVEVSNNGTTWTQIWINPNAELAESAWSPQDYDISAVADKHSTVYVRWGFSIGFGAWAYSGWNIDDIQFLGTPAKRLNLSLPDYALTEGTSATTATVSVPVAPVDDLVIALALNAGTQATLSAAAATILAGTTSATFTMTPTDDALLDGTRTELLSATAATYIGSEIQVTVHDNEAANITVELPVFVTENAIPTTGTLTLSAAPDVPVVVHLASSDMTELTVPNTVMVPAGATTQTFTLTMPNDDEIDGSHMATVSASVVGWTSTSATTEVRDAEALTLTVTLPTGIAENAGTISDIAEVHLAAATSTTLTITLTSSMPTLLTVPASVVIPAGQARAAIPLTPINDPAVTGHRSASVLAELSGFTSSTASLTIYDSQTPALPAQPSPAHLSTGVNPDSDLAWTAPAGTGGVPTSYDVYLGNTSTLGAAELLGTTTTPRYTLPRLTRGATYFWRIVAHLDVLTAEGPTWRFDVPAIGPVHHFSWSTIGATQQADIPFNPTITALDEFGDTAVGYTGSATLSTKGGAGQMVISELNTGSLDEIEFINISDSAVDMSGWQVVFYDESSWPFSLATLTLGNGTTSAAGDVWRVQEFGTPVGSYPLYQIGMNINWTEFSRGGIMLRDKTGGIVDFACFGAPASQVLDPISVPSTAWSGNGIPTSNNAALMYLRTGSSDHNSASDWIAAAPSSGVVNAGLTLPFPGAAGGTPLLPLSTGAFTAGVWTGPVQIRRAHPSVKLVVSDGASHTGTSNVFEVLSLGALSLAIPSLNVTEGNAAQTATLSLPAVRAVDVVVELSSSDASEITVPAQVTIFAGEISTTFPVTIVDDESPDGTQSATITASMIAYDSAAATMNVADNEAGVLSITLPASLAEGQSSSAGAAHVDVTIAPDANLIITLTNADATRLTLPATVTILANTTSATFTMTAVNDAYMDDASSTVLVTASVPGWTSATANAVLIDNETRVLTMTTTSPFIEGAGTYPAMGRVFLPGLPRSDVTVEIASSDTSEITLPNATLLIPAGQSYATFAGSTPDDALIDGTQTVTLSASAVGFTAVMRDVLVRDNDVHHFVFGSVAGSVVTGTLVPVVITAQDIENRNLTSWQGGVLISLTAATGDASAMPVMLSVINGVASGSLLVQGIGTGCIIHADDGAGHLGQSAAFSITLPPVPVIVAEPAFTGGTTNSIAWSSVGSATGIEYEAQRASDAAFTTPTGSGWSGGLGVTFTTLTDGALYHYRVRARKLDGANEQVWLSAWSSAASSTQDATAPVLTTLPLDHSFTTQAAPLITGTTSSDLSGIASITFTPASGPVITATTTDAFATWSAQLGSLALGESSYTLTARDNAIPPNTTTTTWHITRFEVSATPTAAQTKSILAAAFNTDPNNPAAAQPTSGNSVNASDGKTYFTLSYRRRIQPSGFTYRVETSTNLSTWSSLGTDVETVSSTPTGDGITETCTCRITPAIGEGEKKFVRVQVVVE